MEKRKNGKNVPKIEEPVAFNRSIMAAFERQSRGKTCPLCSKKLSLAAYREHLDSCKLSDDDVDIVITASYTGEEAILRRAGPEIVLNEEDPNIEEVDIPPPSSSFVQETDVEVKVSINIEESENTPIKRRRTDENRKVATPPPPPPAPDPLAKIIKESPQTQSNKQVRRRSARIQENNVKVEKPSVPDVLESIEKIETNSVRNSEGKYEIPYYVMFTLRIIKRVLSTPKSDKSKYDEKFWSSEDILKLHRFATAISTDAKCLLVRLFLRRSGWYTVEKLKAKYPEIKSFEAAATELLKCRFFEDDSSLQDMDEAMNLADVQVLKNVAKKIKIDPNKGRPELMKAIKSFANSQKSIFGTVGSVGASILRSIKKELGMCLKIKKDVVDLFKALFTIYCPTTTNSALSIDNSRTNVYQDTLYMMLQVQNGTVKFPCSLPCPNIASFYNERDRIMEYIEAKNMETRMLELMSSGAAGLNPAFDIAILAKDKIDEMPKTLVEHFSNLPVYERKFNSLWVLTRCCGHGATVLEKMKKYGMAVEWHKYLLMSELVSNCCVDVRGIWWDRLLLNLDSHLKEKNECIKMIHEAMKDESVMEKELLMIQDRAAKLLRDDFVPKIDVEEPVKKSITSRILSKDLGDGRVNRFVIRNSEDEDVECSVEEVVRLRYFENEGFTHGLHDEGASWHTLFGLIFYDIIFDVDSYSDTWLSEIQDCPIDMSNTLYTRRKDRFDERFSWLEKAENEEIHEMIRDIWTRKCEETNRECGWKLFANGLEDCVEFFNCIPREGLIAIFGRLAENYRNCRSGFPDLTLWNPTTKAIAVVEVKGPGDRLSTKQRLWLAYFRKSGIQAEVCHVIAENEKRI